MKRIDSITLPYLKSLDFYTGADAGDYAPAVNRAVAVGGSRCEIVLPNRAESYRTQMDLTSGMIVHGAGSATELVQTGAAGTILFKAWGSHGTKTALAVDAVAHARTITLPTGAGAQFVFGDLIGIEANAPVVYGIDGRPRDIRRVMLVAGDVVTIDAGLLFDYTVANGAVFWKLNPLRGITVKEITVTNPDAATNYGTVVDIRRTEDISVSGIRQHDAGGAVAFQDVLNFSIDDCLFDRLRNGTTVNPANTGQGYAVSLSGSCSVGTVSHIIGQAVRHLFTTLAEQRTDPDTFWGGPRDVVISDCVGTSGPDSLAIFDTHEFGSYLTFANCIGEAGPQSPVFQIRARNVVVLNGKGLHSQRGVAITSYAQDCTVQGGEYAFNSVGGVAASGARARIMGVNIHDHATQGGVGIGADDVLVQGCNLERNLYGVDCQSGLRPVVINNNIPWSTGMAYGVWRLPADGKAYNNVVPGYAGANGFRDAVAGSDIRSNFGYKTDATGANSVADGGTIAHGMQRTPTSVRVTPSVAGEFVSVTAISATTFTVAIKTHTGTAGTTQTVYWSAES